MRLLMAAVMQVEVCRAVPEDATVVALLAQVTFRQAFGTVWTDPEVLKNYLRETFAVEKVRASISKPNNAYWLALVDGLPVGYAKMKKHCPYDGLSDPSPAQLQKIYVLNEHIGNRIGEQLQESLIAEARASGKHTLWLAVWVGNDKAIRFYERHGFRKETAYAFDFQGMHFDYDVMTRTP